MKKPFSLKKFLIIFSTASFAIIILFFQACSYVGFQAPGDGLSSQSLNGFTCLEPEYVAPKPIQRLTSKQYSNVVRDLFDRVYSDTFTSNLINNAFLNVTVPDDTGEFSTHDNNLSSFHLDSYFEVAHRLSDAISLNNTDLEQFITTYINYAPENCDLNFSNFSEDCERAFIKNFGLRAYRRPLLESNENNELSILMTDFNSADLSDSLNTLIFRVMLSPQFLMQAYDNDQASPENTSIYTLSPYSMVSKVALTFWNSMPDENLFQLASSASVVDDVFINNILNHVFNNPAMASRLTETIGDFTDEWLHLKNLELPDNNAPAMAHLAADIIFDVSLESSIKSEIKNFISYHMTSESSFEKIYTSNLATTDYQPLMDIYGQRAPASFPITESNKTFLPSDERAGLLTRLSFLSMPRNEESHVLRGAHIKDFILCQKLEEPSDDLNADVTESVPDGSLTTRQRYDHKTSDQSCFVCHSQMNPLGHGLSNYNSFGGYKTFEPIFDADWNYTGDDLPVDSSADLSHPLGVEVGLVNGPIEFSKAVGESSAAKQCYTQKAFSFFNGRTPVVRQDGCQLEGMRQNLDVGGSLTSFLKSLVYSNGFRYRTVE